MKPVLPTQALLADPESLKLFIQEGQKRFGAKVQSKDEEQVWIEKIRNLRRELLPEQLAVMRDKGRKVVAFCTRQAGKSTVACQKMCEAAIQHPRCVIPYIALTKEQCRDIMWTKLQEWTERVGIPVHFNENTMRVTFPNGSVIRMLGAEKPKEILKLLGLVPPLVVIDEGGTFGVHIEQLIKKVIMPGLMRHRGQLLLVGTPGEIADGMFHDATTGKDPGWSVHKWSFLNNIYLPAEERDLDKICREQFQGDYNHPTFLREYKGMWVADAGSRVYSGYDADRCSWTSFDASGKPCMPAGHDWIYSLGVDLGSVDGTTFVVGAFASTSPDMLIVEEHKFKRTKDRHLSVSDVAERLQDLYSRYTFHAPVIDPGALGAMVVEELNRRWGFNLLPAEKQHKNDFIEHFNSDMRLGRVKIQRNSQLASEMARLVWDSRLSPTGKRREKPGMPNDLCDAALYMFRESKHWAGKEVPDDPKHYGVDQVEWEWRKALDKKLEQIEQERRDADWSYT